MKREWTDLELAEHRTLLPSEADPAADPPGTYVPDKTTVCIPLGSRTSSAAASCKKTSIVRSNTNQARKRSQSCRQP